MPETFHFDSELDFVCLRDLVSVIRQGDLANNKYILIDHAAHLLGTTNAYLADANMPLVVGSNPEVDQLNDIEGVAQRIDFELKQQDQSEGFGANPFIQALIQKLIKLIMEQFLNA